MSLPTPIRLPETRRTSPVRYVVAGVVLVAGMAALRILAPGSGGIELEGSRDFRQRFEQWLGLSGFAGIPDARRPARIRLDR